MKRKTITFTMATADRDGVCAAQKRTGAGALTINGDLASSGVATFAVPRHFSLYCAGDIDDVTFTITGTDRYGKALSETKTGPNASTVKGSKNFKTITAVTVSGTIATNVEVGSADEAETRLWPVSYRASTSTYQVELSDDADLTWAFEYTTRDVFSDGFLEDSITYFTDLSAQTGNADNTSCGPFTACRLAITNWTSATDYVYWTVLQADK